jgi:ketosteroid isomerase-like protein
VSTPATTSADELAIRELMMSWRQAAIEGDVAFMREFLSPDILFLIAGQPLMNLEKYVEGSVTLVDAVKLEISGEIEEIVVSSDLAVARQTLTVGLTPKAGGETTTYAGPSMIVFRRAAPGETKWLAWRDANLLGPTKG